MSISHIHTLEQLLRELEPLLKDNTRPILSSHAQSLEKEKQKLVLLERLLDQLKRDAPPPFHFIKEKIELDSSLKQTSRRLLYHVLLVFGVLEDAANSFFFGSALFFSLFPTISNFSLFIASIVYACIESLLFYIYDSAELKDALGIQDPHTSLSPFIEVYAQQLKWAKELNYCLAMMSSLQMNAQLFESYVHAVSLINQNLKYKYQLMQNMHEPLSRKMVRYSVFSFGAISSLTGSYFMAMTLISFCCASIVGTPFGIGLIAFIMMAGILFHYAMDTTSLTRVVNPDYAKFKNLKKNLRDFDAVFSQDLTQLKQLRQCFEKKPTTDCATQAELITPEVMDKPRRLEQLKFNKPGQLGAHSFFNHTASRERSCEIREDLSPCIL